MKTKQQKQSDALFRFSVRPKEKDESQEDYNKYLARKQQERDSLMKSLKK